MRRVLAAVFAAVLSALAIVGVDASPAGAQGCTVQQLAWVLDAHGSVQVLGACNHVVGIAYPAGGGASVTVLDDWIHPSCNFVAIISGDNAGTPALIRYTAISGHACGASGVYGWGGGYVPGGSVGGPCAGPFSNQGSYWSAGFFSVYNGGAATTGCAGQGRVDRWIYGI